jgi:hypothetical protein
VGTAALLAPPVPLGPPGPLSTMKEDMVSARSDNRSRMARVMEGANFHTYVAG